MTAEQPSQKWYDGQILYEWFVYSPDALKGRYRVWAPTEEAAKNRVLAKGKRVNDIKPGDGK